MGLIKYIFKRILVSIPMIFIGVTLTFFITRLVPGDPLIQNVSRPTAYQMAWYFDAYEVHGLDKPIYEQYVLYLRNLITWNWGVSLFLSYNTPVETILKSCIPYSIEIFSLAWVLSFIFGKRLARRGSRRQNTNFEKLFILVCEFGTAIPVFLLGSLWQWVAFTQNIPYFYGLGIKENFHTDDPMYKTGFRLIDSLLELRFDLFFDTCAHYLGPIIILSFALIIHYSRHLRSTFKDIYSQDYIRTSRAKGCTTKQTFTNHVYPNGRITSLSLLGSTFTKFLPNLMIIEMMFLIPGIAGLLVASVEFQDYSVIVASLTICVVIVILLNLITDILYGVADPRISLAS